MSAHSASRRVTLREQVCGFLPVRRPTVLRAPLERREARRLARRYRPEQPPAARRRGCGLADVLVLQLDLPGGQGEASVMLKHAHSAPAIRALEREWTVLAYLRQDERLGAWRRLVPAPLDRDLDGPLPMITQSRLPGRDAATTLRVSPDVVADRVARLAVDALGPLHRATARPEPGAGRVDAWVTAPLTVVRAEVPWCRTGAGAAGLTAVGAWLRDALDARTVAVGWTHGDYHPGNVLMDERAGRVTGIVDWGEARADGPVAVDAVTFALMLRCLRTGADVGPVVAGLLRGDDRAECSSDSDSDSDAGLAEPHPDPHPHPGLGFGLARPDPDFDPDPGPHPDFVTGLADPDLVLLAWLWHVAANVSKSPRYGRSRIWYRRAVAPVLAEAARRSEAVRWPVP